MFMEYAFLAIGLYLAMTTVTCNYVIPLILTTPNPICLSLKQPLPALRPLVPVKAGRQVVPQSSSSEITSSTAYKSSLAQCWSGVRSGSLQYTRCCSIPNFGCKMCGHVHFYQALEAMLEKSALMATSQICFGSLNSKTYLVNQLRQEKKRFENYSQREISKINVKE